MLKIIPRQFNICLYYAKCPICISFFCNNRRIKGSHLCNFSWLPPLQTWPNVPKTIQEQQILGKVEYSKAKNILLINSNLSIFHIKFQKNLNKISHLLWHIFSILCSIIFPIIAQGPDTPVHLDRLSPDENCQGPPARVLQGQLGSPNWLQNDEPT